MPINSTGIKLTFKSGFTGNKLILEKLCDKNLKTYILYDLFSFPWVKLSLKLNFENIWLKFLN